MSRSVEPAAVNGNRPNLSDQLSVLAYWVGTPLILERLEPPMATLRVTRRHPPRREASHERRSHPSHSRVVAAATAAPARAADLRHPQAAPQGTAHRADHGAGDRYPARGQRPGGERVRREPDGQPGPVLAEPVG